MLKHKKIRLGFELTIWFIFASIIIILFKLYPPTPDQLVIRLRTDQRLNGHVAWNDSITGKHYRAPFDTILDGRLLNPEQLTVVVEPILQPDKKSNEVWVYNIQTADRPMTEQTYLQIQQGWTQHKRQRVGLLPLVSTYRGKNEPTPLIYSLSSHGRWAVVHFLHHPYSGIARVTVNNHSQKINLYKEGIAEVQSHIIALPPEPNDIVEISIPVYRLARGALTLDLGDTAAHVQIISMSLTGTREWQWQIEQPFTLGEGITVVQSSNHEGLMLQTSGSTENQIEVQGLPPLLVVSWLDVVATLVLTAILLALGRLGWALLLRAPAWLTVDRPIFIGERPLPSIVRGFGLIMLVVVILQILYLNSRPALLHFDSGEYVVGGAEVLNNLDFSRSREWRPPGYIGFIALSYALFGYSFAGLLLSQTLVYLASIVLAFVAGRCMGGWYVGMGLSLYTALHPAFLVSTRLVMSESLTLMTIFAILTTGWFFFMRPFDWRYAALFALCTAIGVLVRKNVIIVSLPILALALMRAIMLMWKSSPRAHQAKRMILAFGVWVIAYFTVISPWLYRNYQLYGKADVAPNTQRSRLIFWSQMDLIDDRLPLFQPYREIHRYTIGGTSGALADVIRASSVIEAEAKARALISEQIQVRPLEYGAGMLKAFLHIVGVSHENVGFTHQYYDRLLGEVAFDMDAWNEQNRIYGIEWLPEMVDLPPLGGGADFWATSVWSFWWRTVFQHAKLISSILWLITMLFVCYVVLRIPDPQLERRKDVILAAAFCSLVYLGIVAGHAVNLAESDRYILPFEWIPALVSLLGLPIIFGSVLSWRQNNLTRVSKSRSDHEVNTSV